MSRDVIEAGMGNIHLSERPAECQCDSACTDCAGGGCDHCRGTGHRQCEFPCWQRAGLTSSPCCKGCPELPEPEDAA